MRSLPDVQEEPLEPEHLNTHDEDNTDRHSFAPSDQFSLYDCLCMSFLSCRLVKPSYLFRKESCLACHFRNRFELLTQPLPV